MNIENLYQKFISHPVITTDSRNVPSDSIFFALKGDQFDGNEYALAALEKGASWAVIDRKELVSKNSRFILVDDTLTCLQKLANFHRIQLTNTHFIALTGTNGKTTTKELIKTVLGSKYRVTATKGNLNNHIGVPLTILSVSNEDDFAIIEMGANHTGEIAMLCQIAEPDSGLITNIGKAHLEGFGSFDGVKKAKSELYNYLDTNKGVIYYNQDDEILMELINQLGCKTISYGTTNKSMYFAQRLVSNPYLNFEFKADDHELRILVNSQCIGDYNFYNFMAAICIGIHFGLNSENIKESLESYVPAQNRSQLIHTSKNNTLILDAYNANPSSMQAAIQNFLNFQTEKKKILILGEMLELGTFSGEAHSTIADNLKKSGIQAILIGEGFGLIAKQSKIQWFLNVDELKVALTIKNIQDTAILIKGSRGNKLERIVEFL